MKILFKWENCPLGNQDDHTYYYIECPINELSNDIKTLMPEKDKESCLSEEYISAVNDWVDINPELANKNCIYLLVSENINTILLQEVYFPYSSLWNSYSPLKKFEMEIANLFEIKQLKKTLASALK